MTAYPAVNRVKHAVLAPNTVDTVSLKFNSDKLEVYNRDATNDIYFTVNGAVPTVGGDDVWIVGPKSSLQVDEYPNLGTAGLSVQLISVGAAAYSVTGA